MKLLQRRNSPPAAQPEPPAVQRPSEPGEPLTRLERYRLMLRFNVTSDQVDRMPLDIARTLLGLL